MMHHQQHQPLAGDDGRSDGYDQIYPIRLDNTINNNIIDNSVARFYF